MIFYHVTPLLTGVDINVNLNGTHLLRYGIANKTIPPDENFTILVKNFLSKINGSSTLSIIVTVNSFNESMMLYSAYRNFLDIALEWAETTSDALIIVANDKATPANLMNLLELAQQNPNVTEINMVLLTHGILTNETHGMLLWNQEGPKIVEPTFLYQYHTKISKLNFVFLPFCSVEDEFEIYGNNSIKGFFLNIGADEVIGGHGELLLNVEYLSWVQYILLGGIWTDEYGYFEIPVYDNESNECFTLIMEYNFTIAEEELPVIQGNETSLGITVGRGDGRTYQTISKRTLVSVSVKKGVSKITISRISTSKVGMRNWRHISGRAKLSMIEGYLIDPGSGSLSKKKSSLNSISSRINRYKSKIENAKRETLGSFVVADKIISKIYGGYVVAKSKLKRMIYKYFSWIGRFPASLIWSVIATRVLKGVNWLLSRISKDGKFRSLICVAYNMLKAGKSSWEIVLALIGWGVTKFANSILRYFGNFANWLLSKFGSVGSWMKKLINGWIDSSMSFVSNKLAYFEKKLKSSLSEIASAVSYVIELLIVYIKDKLERLLLEQIERVEEIVLSSIDGVYAIYSEVIHLIITLKNIIDTVKQILTVINIIQAIAEISTAGIGAVVTRIVVPLLAAAIINQVLPYIAKHITGTNLDFSFMPMTISDVTCILMNGISGLITFIVPRILSITMIAVLLDYVRGYGRDTQKAIDDILKVITNPLLLIYALAQITIDVELRNYLTSLLGAKGGNVFEAVDTSFDKLLSTQDDFLNQGSIFDDVKQILNNLVAEGEIDKRDAFKAWYASIEAIHLKIMLLLFTALAIAIPDRIPLRNNEDNKINVGNLALLVVYPLIIGFIEEKIAFETAKQQSGIADVDDLSNSAIESVVNIGSKFTAIAIFYTFVADSILEVMDGYKASEEIRKIQNSKLTKEQGASDNWAGEAFLKSVIFITYITKFVANKRLVVALSLIAYLLRMVKMLVDIANVESSDRELETSLVPIIYLLEYISMGLSTAYLVRKAILTLKENEKIASIFHNLLEKLMKRNKINNVVVKSMSPDDSTPDPDKATKVVAKMVNHDMKMTDKLLLLGIRFAVLLVAIYHGFNKDAKTLSLFITMGGVAEKLIDLIANNFKINLLDSATFYYIGSLTQRILLLS